MISSFNQMVVEALAEVATVTPEEAHQQMQQDPDTLIIDVRDVADIASSGTIPGAINISLGSLTYRADHEVPEEWRESQLRDRSRPIVTTCILGSQGALGGKLLKDMGFTDVSILEGGVQAWKDAGLPIQQVGEA